MADNENPNVKNESNAPPANTDPKLPQEPLLTLEQLAEQTGEETFIIIGTLVNAGLQKKMNNKEPLITLTNFKAELTKFKGKEVT